MTWESKVFGALRHTETFFLKIECSVSMKASFKKAMKLDAFSVCGK